MFRDENEICATSVANPVAAKSREHRNASIAMFSPLFRDYGFQKSLATSLTAKENRSHICKHMLRLRRAQGGPHQLATSGGNSS